MNFAKAVLVAIIVAALGIGSAGCYEGPSLEERIAKRKEMETELLESNKPITGTVIADYYEEVEVHDPGYRRETSRKIGALSYFFGSKKTEYVIEEEDGTITRRSDKQIGANPISGDTRTVRIKKPSTRMEKRYKLDIKTDDGEVLVVEVIDGKELYNGSKGGVKELDEKITTGTRISFPRGNRFPCTSFDSYGNYGYTHSSWMMGDWNMVLEHEGETYFTPETQTGSKRADRITVLSEK